FPDIKQSISLYLVNDVLHNRMGVLADNPNATITMNKSVFNDILTKKTTGLKQVLAGNITIQGSKSDYADFQKMVGTPFELLFNIVEP
ncbi:MAG: alkyl sulfatase C-terminal domain-containing protein, partial [Saprospiraceae bacterium]